MVRALDDSMAMDGIDAARLQRRTLITLVGSQILGGIGLGSGVAVGALLARDMLGSTSLSGLPAALIALGGATAAFQIGRLSQKSGRRFGLAAGYATSAIGGVLVILAAVINLAPLLLIGLFLYGAGSATNLQARYAGADLAPPTARGRAVSTVLVATTVGAVIGPNLIDPMGNVGHALGIPRLAGPFLLATAAYALAAVYLHYFLRPDPLVVARGLHRPQVPGALNTPEIAHDLTFSEFWGHHTLALGAATMVITQIVMTSIMTMTPIHMQDHGLTLGDTGIVISIHIACMYLPSLFTGVLVDRFGPRPIVLLSTAVLLTAGIIAATSPNQSVFVLSIGLGLLGFGWNLGLISGTAIVASSISINQRARIQGTIDLAVSLAGASAGFSSGIMVQETSYFTLSVVAGIVGLLLVPMLARGRGTTATAS